MPILTLEGLKSDLARGCFQPVYLFFGSEELQLREAVARLRAEATTPETRSFNYFEFSGQDADAAEIVKNANTFPMMSPRRLVLVTEVGALPAESLEKLIEYAASPQTKTVMVLVWVDVDRRTSFYKRMVECAGVIEFAKLKGPALERWATSYLAERGFHIAPTALGRLLDYAGSDLLSLANVMEKLVLYCGEEREIPLSAVDALVPASRQHGIFDLTAAMGKRDRRLALRLLGNLLEGGEPPLVILTMMARHFRQIIIAKELLARGRQSGEIRAAAQVPEFVMPELLRQARAIEADLARELFQRLAGIDRRFKSSRPDERMLLERLVCSL